MSQEKTERYTISKEILCDDVITTISRYLESADESQEIKNKRREYFPIFCTKDIQNNRILTKLAQYAFEGNIERVASLLKIRPDLRLNVLFTLAGLGAQDEMEPILRQHPEDLLVYRPLRDISGAVFDCISLFKHVLWTKDVRYMANMMLDCLPKNARGEEIRLKLVGQYEELIANGVVYHLHGIKHENEQHFSLQPLITALRTYLEQFNGWTEIQRELHWCTVVGLAQTLIPAHIRHHYCDPEETFWDNPNFKKPKLNRSLELYNWVLKEWQLWSEGLIGLGEKFGIYGGRAAGGCERQWWGGGPGEMRENLSALTALDGVRTTIDMPLLIKQLYTPIQTLEYEKETSKEEHQEIKFFKEQCTNTSFIQEKSYPTVGICRLI